MDLLNLKKIFNKIECSQWTLNLIFSFQILNKNNDI